MLEGDRESDCSWVAMPSSIDDILAAMGGGRSAATPPSPPATAPVQSAAPPPPLDDAHRVADGVEGVRYGFKSAMLRLDDGAQAAALAADCAQIFEVQEGSNWLAATATPRCSLERLARAVFERHTKDACFDPERSGAEWWAQVRGGLGASAEGIEFHWDVDEHYCDLPGARGLHVHPHLSTVTYLSDVGAPTLVLDVRSPSASVEATTARAHGPVARGALSWPRLAKHVAFDGSLLHGAVPCLGESVPAGRGVRRVTFLVNVWLNHRPHAVTALPKQLARSLSQSWPAATLPPGGAFLGKDPIQTLQIAAPPPTGRRADASSADGDDEPARLLWLQVAFGKNEKAHALRVRLPRRPPPGEATSLRLLFAEGAADVSRHVRGLKPTVTTVTTARVTGGDSAGSAAHGGAPGGGAAGSASGGPAQMVASVKRHRPSQHDCTRSGGVATVGTAPAGGGGAGVGVGAGAERGDSSSSAGGELRTKKKRRRR